VHDIVIHVVASACYAGLAWHFWNTRWRATAPAASQAGLASWERAALLVPLSLHGWLLAATFFVATELRFGFAQALSTMLWLGVVIYWVESLFLRLDGFEPLILPLAAVAVPLAAVFPGIPSSHATNSGFKLHLALAMIAYSLFTMAMLHAVLMAFVESRLHRVHRSDAGFLARLPPLLTLERLLFHTIAAAFAMLTLTLVTGVAFSEAIFGRALRFDHKTLFAILSWATFALLLAGRHLRVWRGRTALRMTMAGFLLLLLAYIGSRFVAEVLLGRS